jgi:hypothetical protein
MRGEESITFRAPVGGKVQDLNGALQDDPGRVTQSPYKDGWICRLEPADLAAQLAVMKIGQPAMAWYGEEIQRLQAVRAAKADSAQPLPWSELQVFLAQ